MNGETILHYKNIEKLGEGGLVCHSQVKNCEVINDW